MHFVLMLATYNSVVNIVEGNIPPLDPTMPEDRRVTIHNNMIFSQGPDSKESFEKIGGPEAWHVIMAKEVQGTKLINDLDVDGLHTMATAVVEYKGRRFVAQTLVPGFLTRMAAAPVIHGIVEEEKRIAWDEQMATIFDEVGKKLHLAQHLVKGTEGKDHVFRTSAETKGIKGCDGRSYILDLYRLQPVDIRFLEEADKDASNPYPHRLCLVRPEVVEQYWISKLRQHIVDKRAEVSIARSTPFRRV